MIQYNTEGVDFTAIMSSQVTFTIGNQVESLVIPILSSNSTEINEEFTITLDEVILIHTNDSTLNISDCGTARLGLNPRVATITIVDDNGKITTNIMNSYYPIHVASSCCDWFPRH